MEILTRPAAWKVTKTRFFAVDDIITKQKKNISEYRTLSGSHSQRGMLTFLIQFGDFFFPIYIYFSRDSNYNDTTVKETKI